MDTTGPSATDFVPVAELIREQARRTPRAIAVECGERRYTYARLEREIDVLSARLASAGVGAGQVVGVLLERGVDLVVALVAVMRAGAAYLPLDPEHPAARRNQLIADAGVVLLLTRPALDEASEIGVPALYVADGSGRAGRATRVRFPRIDPEGLAYLIYTSGSTGQPKGVMVTHGSLTRMARSVARRPGLAPGVVLVAVATIAFDMSVFELIVPLTAGACVVLADADQARDPAELSDVLTSTGATAMVATPTTWQMLLDAGWTGGAGGFLALSGGEKLSPELATRLGRIAEVWDGYGPTETTVCVWWSRVTAAGPVDFSLVDGAAVHLLDDDLNPVATGEDGEIYLGGACVARGYHGRPDLTADRYQPDPWIAGRRMYRTGDLGRRGADGHIAVVGRIDQQVKIRGNRVEPAEIEAVLLDHPHIRQVVVHPMRVRSDEPVRLVAIFVPQPGIEVPTAAELRGYLTDRMPDYLVPALFAPIASLPTTTSGKLDVKALTRHALCTAAPALTPTTAPRTAMQTAIAGELGSALGVESIDIDTSLLDLGADSLILATHSGWLRRRFGVAVSVRQIFTGPTVRSLAAHVERLVADAGGDDDIVPLSASATERTEAPLSFSQRGLWLVEQLGTSTSAYHLSLALRLSGPVDEVALQRAVRDLVERHRSLRTVIGWDSSEPVSRLMESSLVPFDVAVCVAASVDAIEEVAAARLRAFIDAPFDLMVQAPCRVRLLRLSATEHLLVVVAHHIATDGWSESILCADLANLYSAHTTGTAVDLPVLPVHYLDFAAWQHANADRAGREAQVEQWRAHLCGLRPFELPGDFARPAHLTGAGSGHHFTIEAGLAAAVRGLAVRCGVTPYMVLLSAFFVLLGRYANRPDVVVGSSVANRDRAELAGLVGNFVNTVVLRGDLSGDPSFTDVVSRVRDEVVGALGRREVPFEQVVQAVAPARDLSRNPLFQIMFAYLPAPADPGAWRGLRVRRERTPASYSTFDLTLSLRVSPDSAALAGYIEFSTELFRPDTIRRLARHLNEILASAVDDPEVSVRDVAVLPDSDLHAMVVDWNSDFEPMPAGSLPDLIAAQDPAAPAVCCGGVELDYATLVHDARTLAAHLRDLGVGAERPAAICLPRSVELIVASIAVMMAGGCYLALDPDHPADRLGFMVDDAKPAAVISRGALPFDAPTTLPVVDLDAPRPDIDLATALTPVDPDQAAALIYTSGSTGTPKAAVISHRNVLAAVTGRGRYPEPPESLLLPVSFAFDVFLSFASWTLCTGGRLVLPTESLGVDLDELASLIAEHRITHLVGPPHLHRALLDSDNGVTFNRLAVAITGGEACPPELVADLARVAPRLRLINEYGPTEAGWGTYLDTTAADLGDGPVPIGRPPANYRVLLLDRHLRQVPVGVEAELYIGGPGLSRGYLGRPGLTAERFIPDPYAPAPGARLYRSGDLACYRPDGIVEFLGRVDQQVKLHGHRIELGEIESALARHPDVAAAVVRHRPEHESLAGYVVARSTVAPAVEELRAFLRRSLPEPMIPASLMVIDALPTTPNGKVDRAALPEPPDGNVDDAVARADRPRTAAEAIIAEAWAEALVGQQFGIHDDFFALGGYSLLAAAVVSRLRGRLPVEVAISDIFEAPTIAQLAALLGERLQRQMTQTFGVPDGAEAEPVVPEPIDHEAVGAGRVMPVDRSGPIPLSFGQQRLWLLDRMDPGNVDYLAPLALRLRGPLDFAALIAAVNAVVARHEVLRTRYEISDGDPVQRIDPIDTLNVAVTDLEPIGSADAAISAWVDTQLRRPIDLATSWPLRADVLRVGPEDHVLLIVFHHIACDAASVQLFGEELAARYESAVSDRPCRLAPLPVQYADYAVANRAAVDSPEAVFALDDWKRALVGLTDLELPADRPRGSARDTRGDGVEFTIEAGLAAAVRGLAVRCGVTPYMVLLSAFFVLLGRYANRPDVVVGSPVANRDRAELAGLVGFFLNTVVLRGDLSDDPSFTDVVSRVRDEVVGALGRREVPFEQVVQAVAPARDLSRNPLFQVMFSYQSSAPRLPRLAGLGVASVPTGRRAAKFDLILELTEGSDGAVDGVVEYATALYDRSTMLRVANHFVALLSRATRRPDQPIDALEMVTAAERGNLTVDPSVPATDARLHQLVEAQVRRTPGATAVVHSDGETSYAALNAEANRLAHRLMARGVGPETFVGVCVPRGPRLVVALLAVLKAGGAYVPLDPDHPAPRLEYALAAAHADIVIGTAATLDRLAPRVRVDVDDDDSSYPEHDPDLAVDPRQAAYAIFTSGSTGVPKGVVIPHQGIVNRVQWTVGAHALGAGDRVLQKTTMSFDAAGWEFFAPLASGGAVVLASPGAQRDPALMVADIRAHRVTVLQAVPSMLRPLLEEPTLPSCTSLRLVFSAGEELRTELCERLVAALGVTVHNTYGPTEYSIDATAWHYRPGNWGVSVPIGAPIDHTAARILDVGGQLVPPGVAGELYLIGVGLARGYLGRPDLTAARFVPDPYATVPGGRLYRTGDLARWRADGDIDFLGRVDAEVKIRGVRVDPGEIETALVAHDSVVESVVVAWPGGRGGPRLVAYVVAAPGASGAPGDVDTAELRAYLVSRLPEQFVPAVIMALDRFPYTASGKVDRAALPEPDGYARNDRAGYRAPRTATERVVVGVFADVLGLDRVGVDDDFFAVGGHSLLAIRAALRLRQAFATDVAVSTLFEARTAAGLAERLAPGTTAGGADLVPYDRGGPLPLSHAQQRLWFLHRLDPASAEYQAPIALRLNGALDPDAVARAVNAVVARHEVLRTRYASVDGVPHQIVDPPPRLPLDRRDVRHHEHPELAAAELVTTEAGRPFDLAAEAPLRALLVTIAADVHVVLLTTHHIACDGWSLDVIGRDLAEAYRGGALEPLAIQYADYAAWQHARAAGQRTGLAWWCRELAGVTPLDLPTDRPRPAVRSADGAVYAFGIPAGVARAVTRIGGAHQATPFMTMLAAFQALIAGWTGRRDFVVGTPVAGRDHAAVEGLVGCFVNTVPLRANVDGAPTFSELLGRVRVAATDAYGHADVPFEQLIDALGTVRDLSRTPLAEVMFTLDEAPDSGFALGEAIASSYPVGFRSAMCDLTLSLRGRPDGGYDAEFEYASALFAPATAARLAGDLLGLLDAVAKDPHRELVFDGAATPDLTGGELAPVGSIPELFAAAAGDAPDAVAVVDSTAPDGPVELTFAELDREVAELAARLPVAPGDRVGVCLPRGAGVVISLLAILRAGGVYVPLDPDGPAERREFVVGDTGARVVITDRRHVRTFRDLPAKLVDLADRDTGAGTRPPVPVADDDPAYVVYTSGSSGRPKGVVVGHGSYAGHCVVQAEAYGLGPGERLALMASLTFDASLDQIAATLISRATVLVVDPRALTPERLVDVLDAAGATVMDITPAYFRELVAVLRPDDGRLAGLRLMSVGGDVVTFDDVRRWRTAGRTSTFASMYGPTEATIGCTMYTVTDADLADAGADDTVPIGHALRGTGAYVLGPDQRPVPAGAVGELYIGGDRVAQGYRHEPALTADRFAPDPFRNRPGARMYRTGDLVRTGRDGAITFIGRVDNQVKIRGFRVELGEIEAALAAHPSVHAVAVTVGEPRPGDRRIAAYVVPIGDVAAADLAAYLRGRLPEYMVPATWMSLAALPLTPNNKVDRKALPAPDWNRPELAGDYVAPDGPVEEMVADVWADVLGLDRVGVHDDFFALGGNSLLGMRMLLRLTEEFDLELPLRMIFEERTVAKLAAVVLRRLIDEERR